MISADTLTICICPAMFMCSDFFQNFILGPIGCKLDGFLQGFRFNSALFCKFPQRLIVFFSRNLYFDTFLSVTILLTAVLNLCVVSYDRLTAIVLPMERRITMRGAKMAMFLTWMVSLTLSIPFAVYRNYKVYWGFSVNYDTYVVLYARKLFSMHFTYFTCTFIT